MKNTKAHGMLSSEVDLNMRSDYGLTLSYSISFSIAFFDEHFQMTIYWFGVHDSPNFIQSNHWRLWNSKKLGNKL